MEIKLINQQLQKDFTTKGEVDLEDRNDGKTFPAVIIFNGQEYGYQNPKDRDTDMQTLASYCRKLQNAMFN